MFAPWVLWPLGAVATALLELPWFAPEVAWPLAAVAVELLLELPLCVPWVAWLRDAGVAALGRSGAVTGDLSCSEPS